MKQSRAQHIGMMAVAAAFMLTGPLAAGCAGGKAKGDSSAQAGQQGTRSGQTARTGVAKGESSAQVGQQGMGLDPGGKSSNIIMGGPDILVGTISKIQGEQYSIKGDRGQEISLRVTKNTNMVCSEGGTKISSGHQGRKENQEIPPTQSMERQPHQSGMQKEAGALSKDPSQLKDHIGTTDPSANADTAKGSGFAMGTCNFKVGDQVRVEGSDMGTATTIHRMAESSR